MKFEGSFSSKYPRVKTSIFTQISQLAQEHKAINLSQGFPSFDVNEELKGLVKKHIDAGDNQYAPSRGVLSLRQVLSEWYEEKHQYKYAPENEILITAGATQAIFTTISALVKEEDEVIVFTPAYDCYVPAIENAGGKAVYVKMSLPDYKIDWKEVKRVFSRKTKMIIINTPHNPTGEVINENDIQELIKITDNSDTIILSDEVYEHIMFDGKEHLSLSKYPELNCKSIIVSSFGKTFNATGWKIGYLRGPSNLVEEIHKLHQYNVFAVNTPIQMALADYLENHRSQINLNDFYQEHRDYFLDLIKDSRFTFTPSKSSYFQILNYKAISEEKDIDFVKRMIEEYKIAFIPVSSFYHTPNENEFNVRVCFAKDKTTLKAAADIINKL